MVGNPYLTGLWKGCPSSAGNRRSCRRILELPQQTIPINLDNVSDILTCPGGRRLDDPVLAMLRGQLADIISGAIFSFAGLAVCSIAAVGRRSGVRLFVWLGIWSAMYGAGLLTQSQAVVAALPHWIQIRFPMSTR